MKHPATQACTPAYSGTMVSSMVPLSNTMVESKGKERRKEGGEGRGGEGRGGEGRGGEEKEEKEGRKTMTLLKV